MSISENQPVKVLITGDYFLASEVANDNNTIGDIFSGLLPQVKASDIAITNLEAPVTISSSAISKTGPAIKASLSSLQLIRSAGFNMVTLASNHIMDYGNQGLLDTLQSCDNLKMKHIGVGTSLKEANRIHYENIRGICLAFINFTENEFSTTSGTFPGANPLNPVENYRTIRQAKETADHVIVIVHGGHEKYQLPSPRMKSTYRFFIDAGASAVVGHHTHCYSGYEVYKGSPVFYSLGNFIFEWHGSKDENWFHGYAVKFDILKEALSFEIIPYVLERNREAIRLLQNIEKEKFDTNITALNAVIQDDEKLEEAFGQYYKRVEKSYKAYLEPHSYRLLHALQNRGLFPSFLSSKKKRLLMNIIRCESHRDMVLKVLAEK